MALPRGLQLPDCEEAPLPECGEAVPLQVCAEVVQLPVCAEVPLLVCGVVPLKLLFERVWKQ